MKQISEEELKKILKNWKPLDKNMDSDSGDENYYDYDEDENQESDSDYFNY